MAVMAGNTELSLTTSNYSVIRAVVIVAEHLFEGESCVRLVFTYKESLHVPKHFARTFFWRIRKKWKYKNFFVRANIFLHAIFFVRILFGTCIFFACTQKLFICEVVLECLMYYSGDISVRTSQ